MARLPGPTTARTTSAEVDTAVLPLLAFGSWGIWGMEKEVPKSVTPVSRLSGVSRIKNLSRSKTFRGSKSFLIGITLCNQIHPDISRR